VMKEMGAKPNTVVLYYPEVFWSEYEPKSQVFNKKEASPEELLAHYRDKSTPLVGQKTRMNSATRYSKLPLVVVYYNADFSHQYREGSQYWRKKVLDVAHKFKDSKFRFAVADEEEFQQELADLGLGDSGLEHNVSILISLLSTTIFYYIINYLFRWWCSEWTGGATQWTQRSSRVGS